ncbi:MAG TPA: hypothetical protein VGR37_04745 [Longimicrobiaceae bacterium]|nr:hypothetical protein [Longimicrobiaceae bacterium]
MSRIIRSGTRGLFTAVIAASLGFGATQALASSGDRAPESARQTCTGRCNDECRLAGWSGGYCDEKGYCHCYEL